MYGGKLVVTQTALVKLSGLQTQQKRHEYGKGPVRRRAMGGVIRIYYTYMKLSKNNLLLKENIISPTEVRKSI